MGIAARTIVRGTDISDAALLLEEVRALRQEVRLLQMANDELERLVIHDTLTPLFNRRHFINALNERICRLHRYGTQTALVFIDVNSMKEINDRFGHSAGDYALIHIANTLLGAIRSSDVAARVGGDEFALLIEGLDQDDADEKVEQISQLISQSACVFDGRTLPLSIAAGCTVVRLDDNDFAAIARADMAMYSRKRPSSPAKTLPGAVGTGGTSCL